MRYVNIRPIGDAAIVVGVEPVAAGGAADSVRADPGHAVAGDIRVGFGTAAGQGEFGFQATAGGVKLTKVLVLGRGLGGVCVGSIAGIVVGAAVVAGRNSDGIGGVAAI